VESSVVEILRLNAELGLKLIDLASIYLLQTGKLVLKTVIFNGIVLILMQQIVDFELQFRGGDVLATKLVLQLYQFVLKLNPHLPLVVQLMLILLLCLSELLTLVFQHELDLSHVVIFVGWDLV
jgi:hypothetical protein